MTPALDVKGRSEVEICRQPHPPKRETSESWTERRLPDQCGGERTRKEFRHNGSRFRAEEEYRQIIGKAE